MVSLKKAESALEKSIKDKGHIDNIVVNNYPPFEFVDAGSTDSLVRGSDYDGDLRPVGAAPDIGADEAG